MEQTKISEETTVTNTTTTDKPQVYMKKNIKLVVWTNFNEDKSKSFLNHNLSKVFKKEGEDWKETNGFSLMDLAIVKELIEEYLNKTRPMKTL